MNNQKNVQKIKYYLKIGILAAISVAAASMAVVSLGQGIVSDELFIFALIVQGPAFLVTAVGMMALFIVKVDAWERRQREVQA